MPKPRARHMSIFGYIEPDIYALMNVACKQTNSSISSYIRRAILKDLASRNIISESLAARLIDDPVDPELKSVIAANAKELAKI